MRLIDADSLMEAMYHRAFETDDDTMWQSGCWVRYRAIEQVVNEQPTVDAQPVRRGEWIEDVAYYDEDGCPCVITRCNQCGEPNPVSKFCPHCGAFMKGVRAENVH